MNEFTKKQIVHALREHRLGYTPPVIVLAGLLRDCYQELEKVQDELLLAKEDLAEAEAGL